VVKTKGEKEKLSRNKGTDIERRKDSVTEEQVRGVRGMRCN
jgi:hypothetical protein